MDYRSRQQRFAQALTERKLDAFLVTHLANLRYLCGFTGSSAVLAVSDGRAMFFTDGRYREQSRAEVSGAGIKVARGSPLAAAADWLKKARARRVGLESEHVSLAQKAAFTGLLPSKVRLLPVVGLVERLRAIKDAEEIKRLRAAVKLASGLYGPLLKHIRPGKSESALAAKLEYQARMAGAAGMSFATIVASGPRSALPHGVASLQLIVNNGFIVIDYGVILDGYCSDMTRTLYVGRPGTWETRVYQAVREAQQAAVEAVRPGIETGKVDRAARKVLARAGLLRYFTHSTGHGVGLEIHEIPKLARGQHELLHPGMVVTIEPGVYVPGKGGVRIEDMVLVTERGCEVLTPTPKELITLAG